MKALKFVLISLLSIGSFIPFPVLAEVSVFGEFTREHELQPGANQQGVIEVVNLGATEQIVRVYQTDFTYQADGSFTYPEAGTTARSNVRWIQISPKQFAVPAGEKAVVNYVIQAPDSTLSGSYWSMVMVEPFDEIVPEKKEGIQIRTVVRYGIQIIAQVGNSGKTSLLFQDTQLIRNEMGRFLQIDIENDGDRIARPDIWVEFYDSKGQFKGKFLAKKGKVLPGMSIRSQIDVTELAPDEYKAIIVADCGGDDIFGMNLSLKVEAIQPAEKP